ncbi:NAD-dependent protein deacylase [Candidatus Heimdallarchaeota archaeon B3_Heim]|nr:MAG: NAD-dependent protein deacylase [Candidatus Heimdallarchaeota archaeon B3_Heim]
MKSLDTKITAITGSGVSQSSGIPTFRGTNGLWKKYNVMDLATPQAFARNPKLVWEWYYWRLGLVSQAKPNEAHLALENLESSGYNIVVLTQNVDNLHERAGSSKVIHLHGEIFQRRCIQCHDITIWEPTETFSNPEIPKCIKCNSMLRPKVVWFNETLNSEIIQFSYNRLKETDVLLIIGTSGIVYPVNNFPFIAKEGNMNLETYEFNLELTPLSSETNKTILGPVEKTLPEFISKSFKITKK